MGVSEIELYYVLLLKETCEWEKIMINITNGNCLRPPHAKKSPKGRSLGKSDEHGAKVMEYFFFGCEGLYKQQ